MENIYLAPGAGKKGILLAPGIGKSVADLMTGGETTLSINGYSPDRFATHLDWYIGIEETNRPEDSNLIRQGSTLSKDHFEDEKFDINSIEIDKN